MEENFTLVSRFLNEFCNGKLSPSYDDNIVPVVGSYSLNPNEVFGEVINWVLNYLEQRKCPSELALAIAKKVASKLSSSAFEKASNKNNDKDEGMSWQDTLNLYEEAVREINSCCSLFLEQPDEARSIVSLFSKRFAASSFAIRNKRRKMEDRHVIIHNLNGMLDLKDVPAHSYYAVFDGHAGIDAASYAASQLHINIAKHPEFLTDTTNAIKEAYRVTDAKIVEKSEENENMCSGCTAVGALIRDQTVFLTWLGDSQAVLVKQGTPFTIMNPHKPDREDERKRIEALGGSVTHYGTWRVNGNIAVSRALGDPDHKPFISSEPDINIIELDGSEDFLILACDGLWDEVSSEEAAKTLYQYLNDSSISDPVDTIAAKLVHQSKLQGSDDNITTIVVFLRDVATIRSDSLNFVSLFTPVDKKDDTYEIITDCTEKNSVESYSITKPNVLELNGACGKKINNLSNMLNFPYNSQVVEQSVESFTSETSDLKLENEKLVPNTSTGFNPEATALSELPTPPIDDVLASQQFSQFCATDLHRGLDQVTSDLKQLSLNQKQLTESLALEAETNLSSADIINLETHKASIPEEAIGIASQVVTNAIETAVHCVSSSEVDSAISPIKHSPLNPYAEPFVMKSFFPEDYIDTATASSVSQEQIKESNILSQVDHLGNLIHEALPISAKNELIARVDVEKSNDLETLYSKVPEVSETPIIQSSSSETAKISEQDHVDTINSSYSQIKQEVTLQNNSTEHHFDLLDSVAPNSETNQEAALLLDNLIQGSVTLSQCDSEIKQEPIQDRLLSAMELKQETGLQETIPCNTTAFNSYLENLDISDIQCEVLDVKLDLTVTTPEVKPDSTGVKSELAGVKTDLMGVESDSANMKAESKIIQPESKIMQPESKEIQPKSPEEKPESIGMQPELPEEIPKSKDIESEVKPKSFELKPDALTPEPTEKKASLMLEVEETLLKTAGTELQHDEPLDNVYLQSVPDGIPEAEGVTEDIDSDSEKDGGWSYMKGNPLPSDKNATYVKPVEAAKQEKKVVGKVAPKSTLDSKVKAKTSSVVEKNLKVIGDKKSADLKVKTKIRGSTMPSVVKLDTVKTTIPNARVKKEATVPSTKPAISASSSTKPAISASSNAKPAISASSNAKPAISASSSTKPVSSFAPTKPTRSTMLRNNIATSKTGLGALPAFTSKPKPNTLSTSSRVAPLRPASATATTRTTSAGTGRISTSRPASSATTSKSALVPKAPLRSNPLDVKARPLISKKPVPETKNLDNKETKNSVNTQILAGKIHPISQRKIVTSTPKPNVSTKSFPLVNERLAGPRATLKPVAKAERDKKDVSKQDLAKRDVGKRSFSRNLNKVFATSQPTKDLKSKAAKSTTIAAADKINKKNEDAAAVKNVEVESSQGNISEEEKFILEANIKETVCDEQKAENELSPIVGVEATVVTEAPVTEKVEDALPNVM